MSRVHAGEASDTSLTWSVRRAGRDLVISVSPPRDLGEGGFRPVEVMARRERAPGRLRGLFDSLSRATEAGETVAVQGFEAPRPGGLPMSFTLAIAMAELPASETAGPPGGSVSDFDLPCGPGIRIHRLTQTDGRPPITQFTATYLARTEYGELALAFATPHVEGGPEFAVLFDVIARSCAITPA